MEYFGTDMMIRLPNASDKNEVTDFYKLSRNPSVGEPHVGSKIVNGSCGILSPEVSSEEDDRRNVAHRKTDETTPLV